MKSIGNIHTTALFSFTLLGFMAPSLASPSASERSDLESRGEEAFLDLDASLDPQPRSDENDRKADSNARASTDEIDPQRNLIEETTVVAEEQSRHEGHQVEPTQQELYKRLLQEEADSSGYRHDQWSESSTDRGDWAETPRAQPTAIVVEERPRRRWYERRHYGLWHLLHHLNAHQHSVNDHARHKHQRRAKRNYRKKRHAKAKRKAQRKARRIKRNHRRSSRARRGEHRRRR